MAEMNKSTQNALGLATGVIFGALLQRGGLSDSRTIVAQLTGDDNRVAKTMGTAVAVGALGHRFLRLRGLATAAPKPLNPVGVVGGAVLFGAGMALSGYCPGTAAAAAGSGRREAHETPQPDAAPRTQARQRQRRHRYPLRRNPMPARRRSAPWPAREAYTRGCR